MIVEFINAKEMELLMPIPTDADSSIINVENNNNLNVDNPQVPNNEPAAVNPYTTDTQRLHPMFNKVNEPVDSTFFPSDHLPILTSVPLTNGQNINIISLNCLGQNGDSGLLKENDESQEQFLARYRWIASRLKDAADVDSENKVDVIALQEFSMSGLTAFQENLGAEWDIVIDDKLSIATCYRKSKLQFAPNTQPQVDSKNRTLSVHFTLTEFPDEDIEIHNVWGYFDNYPADKEEYYRTLLMNSKAKNKVIIGDTNSRVAPLHDDEVNGITGVVPVKFSNKRPEMQERQDEQVPDFPDGAFALINGKIKQLATHVINYFTGKPIIDKRSPQEINAYSKPLMILCLDDSYQVRKAVGSANIFEFERNVQELLQDKGIMCRFTADVYNHKGIGIRFGKSALSQDLCSFLQEKFNTDADIIWQDIYSEDRACSYFTVSVPLAKTQQLQEAIKDYVEHTTNLFMAQLEQYIADSEAFRLRELFMSKNTAKVEVLKSLLADVKGAVAKKEPFSLRKLIEDWEEKKECVLAIDEQGKEIEKEQRVKVSNKEVISQHRNGFFPAKREDVKTATVEYLDVWKKHLKDNVLLDEAHYPKLN